MTFLLNIFGNIKNIVMAGFAIFAGLYIAKMKYNKYQAEDKLKTIENKIAKTNVVVAKTKAQAKAKAVKAETDIHIETLKELKKESKIVQKEMADIEKKIEVAKKEKKPVIGRTRGKKISIDV